MESKNIAVLIIVLTLAVLGVVYMTYFTGNEFSYVPLIERQSENENENENTNRRQINFEDEGYLVYGNPGLAPNTLFFIYEEVGAPALSAEVVLDSESQCLINNESSLCRDIETPLHELLDNRLLRITGFLEDGKLFVVTLETVNL
jgi:hypothetical protein